METYSFWSRGKREPVKQQGVLPLGDPGENPPGENCLAPACEPLSEPHREHPPFHSKHPEWEWETDRLKKGISTFADRLEAGAEKLQSETRTLIGKMTGKSGPCESEHVEFMQMTERGPETKMNACEDFYTHGTAAKI